MKRFSETCRFDEAWYSEMSPELKCAYEFIWARADNAGVWSVNKKLVEFQIGKKINWTEFMEKVGGRVIVINESEWMLCGFVEMQCGKLSLDCRPHRVVIELLKRRGLLSDSLSIDYPKGSLLPFNTITVQEQVTGPVQKGEVQEGIKPEVEILEYLNTATGGKYRPVETNLDLIRCRMKEPGVTADGVKLMIDRQIKLWKGTEYEQYLAPTTLFRKEKFPKYYDQREMKVNGTGQRNGEYQEQIDIEKFTFRA